VAPQPRSICLVGVGLITGSLGLALRAAGAAVEVTGFGRDPRRLEKARALGAIDRFSTDPHQVVAQADVVVLGVPLGAVAPVLDQLAPALPADAVLTDVGSAKGCVVADVERVLGALPAGFVPGHPIAGTEHSGVEAAFAQLYQNRRVILTPTRATRPGATETITAMWQAAGASVTTMSVAHHDRMLAMTSHLPHMLAFGLVDMLSRAPDHEEILDYAAGGFRDFTRIASSDPVMWRDVCLGNREAILSALGDYQRDLTELARLIESADAAGLESVFASAKATRDANRHRFED